MVDIDSNSESTGESKVDIRSSLAAKFSESDETASVERESVEPEKDDEEEVEEPQEEGSQDDVPEESATDDQPAEAPVEATQPQTERIPLVPPADMNKAEKEAFLNPTAENAHVLQQYMNRRAYETRSDYQRRVNELEQVKQHINPVFETLKQYENDYVKRGVSLTDVARRAVLWDQEMQKDPINTAKQWLESYGVNPDDLFYANEDQGQQYPQQPQQQYLTREQAEQIAEEKLQTAMQSQLAEQQQKAVAYYNERAVESFISAKPLFKDPETASQLEAEMAPIVQALTNTGKYSSPEEILETAYNYVVNGNPTFSSLHSAMTAKARVQEKMVAVQKAKAASKSITGSAGSGTPRIQVKDLRDNLRRRMSGD
jgi:hypothetical protein